MKHEPPPHPHAPVEVVQSLFVDVLAGTMDVIPLDIPSIVVNEIDVELLQVLRQLIGGSLKRTHAFPTVRMIDR